MAKPNKTCKKVEIVGGHFLDENGNPHPVGTELVVESGAAERFKAEGFVKILGDDQPVVAKTEKPVDAEKPPVKRGRKAKAEDDPEAETAPEEESE